MDVNVLFFYDFELLFACRLEVDYFTRIFGLAFVEIVDLLIFLLVIVVVF